MINGNKFKERVVFATDNSDAGRILRMAEKQTGAKTNAVTYVDDNGWTNVIFRNRQVSTAEVLEEMRHLGQARTGFWNKGFVARELDAGAYLWRVSRGRNGMLSSGDIEETVGNLMHHTGMSAEQVLLIMMRGVK